MSSSSPSSLAYSNDDIDPVILADVTRVIQELMRMQQLELEQQQQEQSEHHNQNTHETTISREFQGQDSFKCDDSMDVDISPLPSQEKETMSIDALKEKGPVQQEKVINDHTGGCEITDQSLLLPSSSISSSIVSPSDSTKLSLLPCSAKPTTSGKILTPTLSPLAISTDQAQINVLSGQKTPTRATSSVSGLTNNSDELNHKYYEHEPMDIDTNNTNINSNNNNPNNNSVSSIKQQASPVTAISRPISVAPSRPKRKKALLIGINYFGDPNQLLGCINDTRDVFGFLNGHFGFRYQDTVMLTDDNVYEDKRPTGANIRYWMKWLIKDAEPQDSLFFHYAGHGGRIKDFSYNGKEEHLGDEADGYDEIIYPCDYLRSGIISDDEMYDLMVKELPAGVQLTALVDACHSGTMLDLPYVYNGNHVTALEKVTRTKVGAMAAMSASDITFDLPGSNNMMTTTTTTTTTTVTVRNADGTEVVHQVTNGTVMSKDGNLTPPGGIPEINTKEGSSPLLSSGSASKRSIEATQDKDEDEDINNSPQESHTDEIIPSLNISEIVSTAPIKESTSIPFLTVESASDDSDCEGIRPSPRKRSRSVNNVITMNSANVSNEELAESRGIETSNIEIEEVIEITPENKNEVMSLTKQESSNNSSVVEKLNSPTPSESSDDGLEEARKMALFRKTKGNVVMFSGCRDDQASADIRASAKDAEIISNHHKSLAAGSATANWSSPQVEDAPNPLGYSLPQPYSSPLARGAVSYAWIQCLSQNPKQTYEELLISMRYFMKQRDLEQIPQLGSGMPMDMRTVFTL